MYVCICNRVSDREIVDAVDSGLSSFDALRKELNVATCCGRCEDCARRIMSDAIAQQWQSAPQLAFA